MRDRGLDPINNLLYRTRYHALDAGGRVQVELSCRSCGYILFGLYEEDRCPECGSPIAASLDGELLRTCRPDWLASLARAVRFNAWTTLSLIGAITIVLFTGISEGKILAVSAIFVLWALSSWRLGRPEPSLLRLNRHQLAIRISALLAVSCVIAFLLLATYAPRALRLPILPVIASIAFIIGQFAQLRMLSQLAHRIPQADAGWTAHGRATVLAWVAGACGLVLILETSGLHLCCFTFSVIGLAWWIVIASAVTQLHIADFLRLEAKVSEEHWEFHEKVTQFRQGEKP